MLDAGYWMLDTGCWILDTGYWILDAGYWMLDTGYWILDTGCWILDAGCWMLDAGCWMLDAGCWMLDAGCWMLDTGCWLIRYYSYPISNIITEYRFPVIPQQSGYGYVGFLHLFIYLTKVSGCFGEILVPRNKSHLQTVPVIHQFNH